MLRLPTLSTVGTKERTVVRAGSSALNVTPIAVDAKDRVTPIGLFILGLAYAIVRPIVGCFHLPEPKRLASSAFSGIGFCEGLGFR